jgi:methyl-accepting chemotaxis protein
MFGSKAKQIKELTAENALLREDVETACRHRDSAFKAHEETKGLIAEAREKLEECIEAMQHSDALNQALSEENEDMDREIEYLSGMVGLYESVLSSLRIPVKLPARKK